MRILLFLSFIAACFFSLIGYYGDHSLYAELLSHFKLQYLVVCLILTIITWLFKNKILVYGYIILICILLTDLAPLYFGGNKDVNISNTIKICCANVLSSNGEYEKVKSFIVTEDPDILVLQEVTPLWEILLNSSFKEYKHQLILSRDDNFGIALFSKIPLDTLTQVMVDENHSPSLQATFKLQNDTVSLLAVHPLPPVNDYYYTSRNNQYKEIATFKNKSSENFIVIGDLNSSSFSPLFKTFLKESSLTDSRKGFGLCNTWPTWFKPASITLDHCLISDKIKVKSRSTGPNIGSDHLPIIVEIGLN